MKFIMFIGVNLLLFVMPVNAQIGAMTFTLNSNGGNCNGCEWIAADGVISQETPDILRAYIKQYGNIYDVSFNSPGGNLFASFEIGRILRQQKARVHIAKTIPMPEDPRWKTEVKGTCVDACAYAFLGGQLRGLGNGDLGFHQVLDKKAMENPHLKLFSATGRALDQVVTGKIIEYLSEMGIDLKLYEFIVSDPSIDIVFLSEKNALKFGVSNSDGTSAQDWHLVPFENGLLAETTIRQTYNNQVSSRLRFYCSKGQSYLTLLVSSDSSDDGKTLSSYWREIFSQANPQLSANNEQLVSNFDNVYLSGDGLTIAIVILLNNKSAMIFKKHSSLSSDAFVLGRAQSGAFGIFDIGNIPGDIRMLNWAMENCIN